MSLVSASLVDALRSFPVPNRYVVAFSGGCDSHVLLHALARLRQTHYKEFPALKHLLAIHVNHGLQKDSDHWQDHCEKICAEFDVEFIAVQLKLAVPNGESLEAFARTERYAAINAKLIDGDMLLLAHHKDDQAETVLLQALRGSGVKGLAAMPALVKDNATFKARPLLSLMREQIVEYAKEHELVWVDDPSNDSLHFDRNFLRHEVLPLLKQRWPAAATTLARVATHQAQADSLLSELAQIDIVPCRMDDRFCLNVNELKSLSSNRQRNLLRYWIAEVCQFSLPDAATCQRMLDEVAYAAQDAEPELKWSGNVLRRYRNVLYLERAQAVHEQWLQQWDLSSPLKLPDGRQLIARSVQGAGLHYSDAKQPLSVRYRTGGEKCRLPGREHRHELKKLFQQWGVPPWQRDRIPLVYIGGEIAQIVGYSLCAPFTADPSQIGYDIVIE